jgi:hypothetical protein
VVFGLDDVVPWGRQLWEYERMFALTEVDLAGTVFGCADGPASFNAELTAAGGSVVSGDPLYELDAPAIGERFEQTFETVIAETGRNHDEFVWGDTIPDLQALGRLRRTATERFLADFDTGRAEGRYLTCGVPTLPFADGRFDLALCSHFLFLYSAQFTWQFHLDAVLELSRIAREVRVFPVLELGSVPSRHLTSVLAALRRRGFEAGLERVDYEFQRGGNQMLRVHRPASKS